MTLTTFLIILALIEDTEEKEKPKVTKVLKKRKDKHLIMKEEKVKGVLE